MLYFNLLIKLNVELENFIYRVYYRSCIDGVVYICIEYLFIML